MKKLSKKLLSALCVAALMLGIMLPGMGALAAEPEHTLWLVGDSTVCAFNDAYYYPRYGYGTQIGNYLDGTYKVENLAASGRSSKSFLTDSKANYDKLLAGMTAGDALIIGFGHNDEKAELARYTDPNGDWQTEGSFANSLWTNYVEPAQAKGVEVILCTPIVRLPKNADFSKSELHVTSDTTNAQGTFPGGDYPAAIRKLGEDKNIPVVDLTELTRALYTELTPAKALYLHAWTSEKEGTVDNTHLNIYGAKKVAYILAQALQTSGTKLGEHVDLTTAGEPTQEKDLVSNPDFKPSSGYEPPAADAKSVRWPNYTVGDLVFRGTVFGDCGGDPVAKDTADDTKWANSNWILETDAEGNMRISVTGPKGKISSKTDGGAMYFYQVPASAQIKFSATATLNSDVPLDNQVAFGLMARDDIYIDKNNSTITSDYVMAGALGTNSDPVSCFNRHSGTLNKGPAMTTALTKGGSYKLMIESTPDGYACTFGDDTQTGGFDFKLTTVDSQYVYVGMYVTRNADVTFSNISLVVDGVELGQPDTPDQPEDPDTPDTPDQPEDPDTPDQPSQPDVPMEGMRAGGGLETLFAELEGAKDADVTAVKYTGTMTGELTGDDFTYLVRDVEGGVRIDIPGLTEGTYDLTVTVGDKDYVAKGIQVLAHDRSGFAHQTVADDSSCTPYTEGVGAYNDDGTLKDNAIVLYVTDENKDTVTLSSQDENRSMTVTGIGNILNSNNSKANLFLLRAIALFDKRPLVVRFLGDVTRPQGVSDFKAGSSNGGMVYLLSGANITLEGIGPDATIDGWGFSFGADKNDAEEGLAKNFEVRNLSFRNVPEDCVEVTGRGSDTIEVPVTHAWVHNCAFYVPHIENPAEADKGQGDGALDFKWGLYMTSSYNYFEGYHKTSLIGGDDKNPQYHVTWHHNHWKGCEQRAPLARQADIHIYNNYFEGQTDYCMSLRANTYIFSEANTFSGCKDPVKNETDRSGGGVCKSYGDVFDNCTGKNDATIVTDKSQAVASKNLYANFDTAKDSYVVKGDYKLSSPEDALKSIETYGGPLSLPTTVVFAAVDSEEPGPGTDPEPETPDLSGLELAIQNAKDVYALSDDAVVADGTTASDVAQGKTVYPQSVVTALKSAIADAEAALESAKTQDEVDDATIRLNQAVAAFENAKIEGTKSSGSGVATGTRPSGSTTGNHNNAGTTGNNNATTGNTGTATTTFTDVAGQDWFADAVKTVAEKGLMKGVDANTFAPQQNMTRAMLMTVLARLDEQDTEGGATWYSKAMDWAKAQGISDGTMPESNITREQLVTMLYRYIKSPAVDAAMGMAGFEDVAGISDWAQDAMRWAVQNGILTGKDGARLDPQGNATRAEVATILARFLEKV